MSLKDMDSGTVAVTACAIAALMAFVAIIGMICYYHVNQNTLLKEHPDPIALACAMDVQGFANRNQYLCIIAARGKEP